MTTQKHILIVDPDHGARALLAGLFRVPGGPTLLHATSAGEAAAMVMAREPRVDAMLLVSDLPDEEGEVLCERLRRRGLRLPIIIVSDRTGEADVVRALDAGANDFVARPYRPAELLARLRAQLRAFEVSEDAVLSIGPYLFRPGSRQLQERAGGRRIRLTEKETAVLKHLYRAGGEPVGRKALLREVWGYSPTASTHTVETHIYRLRRKIEPDPARISLLVNEDGGYRLDPEWRQAAEPARRWVMPAGMAAVA